MFKVISAEIKKIVSKPGIYILSLLLAIILVLGAFIYKPKVYESPYFELKGLSFIEKHDDFFAGTNAGKKAEADTKLATAIQSIENYKIYYNLEEISYKEYIISSMEKFQELYDAYQDCYSDDSQNQSHIDSIRFQLVDCLEDLNFSIEAAILGAQNGSYPILTTKSNYNDYTSIYKQVINWAKITVEKEDLKKHFIEFENKYSEKFNTSIKNFKYSNLKPEFVETYTEIKENSKLSILNKRLDVILADIEENYQLAKIDAKFNTKSVDLMDELANKYVETITTYTDLIKYELIVNAFSSLTTNEQLKIMHLSEYSNFDAKSLLSRNQFLFEHNKSEDDYSKPLTIGIASSDKINAFDYSYFVLKVFSFVIISYAILAACHTIAGEIREGSMRYFAIRPVSRMKMFFGKWLAIIVISTILILFSLIISLCVGTAVYGHSANTILSIFNGDIAFTIHPLGMLGIYLVSMFCELIIYSLIAMLLSCAFKSDLMSMTILIIVYLLNTLLPVFIQGANTWLAYYPFSHISLYSLFGSSIYAVQNNFFNLVFGAKVYAGTNVILTVSTILILSILIGFIAVKIFKKKEL